MDQHYSREAKPKSSLLHLFHISSHFIAIAALIFAIVVFVVKMNTSDGVVATRHIQDAAVTAGKLASNSVTGDSLADNSISADHMAVDENHTFADLDLTGRLSQYRLNVEAIPTGIAKTLSSGDSGKLFILNQTTAHDITLPLTASSKGWNAEFVLGTASTSDITILSNAADVNLVRGHIITRTGTDVYNAGFDLITIVGSSATVGNRINLFCDGTYWYLTGISHLTASITVL